MSAPRVFAGMFVTIIVFAIVTYCMTGSLVTTALESIAAIILLQLGYFLCIGYLVWKQSQKAIASGAAEAINAGEAVRDDKTTHLTGAPFNQPGPLGH